MNNITISAKLPSLAIVATPACAPARQISVSQAASLNHRLIQAVATLFLVLALSSVGGIANVAFAAETVNLNKADAAAMQQNLLGIGPIKAESIVSYRKKNGKFNSVDDLLNVKGIGPVLLKKNKRYLSLSKGAVSGDAKKYAASKKQAQAKQSGTSSSSKSGKSSRKDSSKTAAKKSSGTKTTSKSSNSKSDSKSKKSNKKASPTTAKSSRSDSSTAKKAKKSKTTKAKPAKKSSKKSSSKSKKCDKKTGKNCGTKKSKKKNASTT